MHAKEYVAFHVFFCFSRLFLGFCRREDANHRGICSVLLREFATVVVGEERPNPSPPLPTATPKEKTGDHNHTALQHQHRPKQRQSKQTTAAVSSTTRAARHPGSIPAGSSRAPSRPRGCSRGPAASCTPSTAPPAGVVVVVAVETSQRRRHAARPVEFHDATRPSVHKGEQGESGGEATETHTHITAVSKKHVPGCATSTASQPCRPYKTKHFLSYMNPTGTTTDTTGVLQRKQTAITWYHMYRLNTGTQQHLSSLP